MSSPVSKGKIAVVGDEVFVTGFRLGGAKVSYIVENLGNGGNAEKVKQVMTSIYERGDVGVVIVQDRLKNVVESLKRTTMYPLIIYMPSGRTAHEMDVKEYYSSLIRTYLGISLEV